MVKIWWIDAIFRPVDRHEIVKDKSVEEHNAQLVSLVGENRAEMLISAFRSRRSISGPELAGWRLITPRLYKTDSSQCFLLILCSLSTHFCQF